jgi:hypothetical protein
MKNLNKINNNIYIASDEEIKERDWYLVELFKITGESDGFYIEKCTKLDDVWCNNFDVISTRHKDNCKKIIVTTDQDLIKDGVQPIPNEFLEWFVKNPSCESVQLLRCPIEGLYTIISKEEPKKETLEEVRKVERSDLYNKIHSIVRQIPREDVETDAMDASSCAYDIEQLFYKWQQEQLCNSEIIQRIRATKSDAEARRIIKTI